MCRLCCGGWPTAAERLHAALAASMAMSRTPRRCLCFCVLARCWCLRCCRRRWRPALRAGCWRGRLGELLPSLVLLSPGGMNNAASSANASDTGVGHGLPSGSELPTGTAPGTSSCRTCDRVTESLARRVMCCIAADGDGESALTIGFGRWWHCCRYVLGAAPNGSGARLQVLWGLTATVSVAGGAPDSSGAELQVLWVLPAVVSVAGGVGVPDGSGAESQVLWVLPSAVSVTGSSGAPSGSGVKLQEYT